MANVDGREVYNLRTELGLTIREMADKAQGRYPVSASTIGRVEREGVHFTRYASIRGMARVLDVPVLRLIKSSA